MANTTIDTLQLDIVVNSNTATSNLKKTTNEINNLNNSIKGTKKGGGFLKSLNFGAMIGKLYFIRNITKRLSDNLAKMVQYGIDFTETLNLWQTAMRENTGEARIFIAEMNKAYGIAEATLMKYQATFKNMLSAMGKISEDTAYGLSEALTKMALDFASLYNVSIESAMTKFQAVLSGQVRPIRSISGYDIVENTIFDLYKSLGGTKTMRQLSQTEKRLLRIYAVFQQMGTTGALDDLQKTLANNANQLRIMKEQAIEFATWIGNGISHLLQESGILIKINTLLYTAKELAKSLAYELGYREEDFISAMFDSANKANDAIDELQGKLLGFDKFQTLQDTGTSDISIEDALLNAIKEYQSLLSGAVNPAQKESEKLLERMGYQLKVYAKLGKEAFEGTPEEYVKWLENIEESQRNNVQMVEVWNKANGGLLDKIKSIAKGIGGVLSLIVLFKKPLLVLLGAFEYLYITSKDFRDNINDIMLELGTMLKDIGNDFINILSDILPMLVPIIQSVFTIIKKIVPLISKLMPLVNAILTAVADLMPTIIELVDSLMPILNDIVASLVPVLVELIQSIVPIIREILKIVVKLTPFINELVKPLLDLIVLIVKNVSILLGYVGKLFELMNNSGFVDGFITGFLSPVVAFVEIIAKALQTIHEVFNSLLTWNWSGLGSKIKGIWDSWTDSSKGIGNFFSRWFKTIKDNNITFPTLQFANGGGFSSADLFYANENGQTELIASNNRGGGAVMNMEQLQTAITRGMLVAMASNESDQQINLNVNVGNENWFNITRKVAQQNGYDLVKVR